MQHQTAVYLEDCVGNMAVKENMVEMAALRHCIVFSPPAISSPLLLPSEGGLCLLSFVALWPIAIVMFVDRDAFPRMMTLPLGPWHDR